MQKVMEAKHIGFYYSKRKGYFRNHHHWAIKDVSFDLYKGESLGILGKNGAGKSTLLKILAEIYRPDEGALINYGYSTTLLSVQAGFIPYLTGRENTLLNGMYLGLKKKVILDNIEQIKSFSELDTFFEQPISSYSSGMRARLGFSIAFQLDPDILLLDEVLAVGDESFKEKSSKALKEKIRSDKTVVLVSHSPNQIKKLCNRAVLIDGGKSVYAGSPEDVLDVYHNSY